MPPDVATEEVDPTVKPDMSVTMPKSAKTVTVACKHPGGLIMRLFKMGDAIEAKPAGGINKFKRAELLPGAPIIKINGPALNQGQRPDFQLVGGYALTQNVPEDFFAEWLKQNHDLDLVRNRMIFAHVEPASAGAQAKDQKGIKSGMEPINPRDLKNDPRIPRNTKGRPLVETADVR